ncbi:STAS domain-containing protein [Labrenzia sp. PHM005]|uniref:STAS domain-containing protein n=1 Tax=Labrenzia sp. PHM005 TaxID=2590016 RepID=UPI0011403FF3|nr:STAS domain-containing protein [Labrenzia sp. PHM005]QDG78902.1 STAS domain-containing protein [Labrenzia sp. PHM005]
MTSDTNSPFQLPSCVDFSRVQQLAEDLRAAQLENSNLQIDAGEVDQIGTPAAQVLVAAALQAGSDGQQFEVISQTESFQQVFEDLGLSDQIEQWSKD